ncbi:MAG: TetR/AcrR family transcriptional regulator [Gloeomargaritaceae cyanobacterium C42_A2020_066]|nr:TetR/AcrR family transcriptional regulator [Gloeomargaritaceae cyanobacterium C42_A2020_066]
MPRETYIPCLMDLFQQHGYDGATLARISAATGLGKASLYHYFPGGKEEMAVAVFEYLEGWMSDHILPALRGEGDGLTRLQRMCTQFNTLYEGGHRPCLLAIVLMGSARGLFHDRIRQVFQTWLAAIAEVLVEMGLPADLAQQRSEDAAISIQGSLVLALALDDPSPFQRVLQELPAELCRPADAS